MARRGHEKRLKPVDAVVGTDRIAANGDTATKSNLDLRFSQSITAYLFTLPPYSTIDLSTKCGARHCYLNSGRPMEVSSCGMKSA